MECLPSGRTTPASQVHRRQGMPMKRDPPQGTPLKALRNRWTHLTNKIIFININVSILKAMSTAEQSTLVPEIRSILSQHGRMTVEQLQEGDDLYSAGLTSLATVAVMLALEDKFNVEFPDTMMGRKTFKSIESIADAITQLAA
jgi:acyl carrier protein